jgi:hypothetical protein
VLGEFMSYDIDGYIELQAYDTYFAAINLFPFIYMTDYVSNRLFGLTKYPHDPIAFEKRGIPIDASETVKEEYRTYALTKDKKYKFNINQIIIKIKLNCHNFHKNRDAR